MKYPKNNAVQPVRYLTLIAMLLVTAPSAAVDFPQYPDSIRLIEGETLPIELIKTECKAINVEENFSSCILNTMNYWASYRRAVKEHSEIAKLCYTSLKELDDYMLVDKCIEASVEGNSYPPSDVIDKQTTRQN